MDKAKSSLLMHNIEDLLEDQSFFKVFKASSLKQLPSKKRWVLLFLMFTFIYIFLYYNQKFNANIVLESLEMVKEINSILLPLFAVIITGYAIFQALVNGSTLVNLMAVEENGISKFKHYNLSFLSIALYYLILIITNFILYFVLSLINTDWYISFFCKETNTILFIYFFSIYLVILINALFELKSFIYNLYQIFSINAVSQTIKYITKVNTSKSKE